jgi:predicted ribosomally synthesized peptide with SipW-like signal peptide
MSKIIVSLSIVAAVAAVVAGGTYAYFSDTQTSSGNTFTAGTLTLALSKDSGYSPNATGLFTESDMAPGVPTAAKTLYFKNTGSIAGKVKLTTTYTLTNGGKGGINATDFAKHMVVTSGVTDGLAVQTYWAQHVIDTYSGATAALADNAIYDTGSGVYTPTVWGLSKVTLKFEQTYNGTPVQWNALATHTVALVMMLDPNVGNDYQYSAGTVSLTADMVQWENTTF